MWRKIGENAVLFLFLFGFISFCWTNRGEELTEGTIGVTLSRVLDTETETAWESEYPASLLPGETINVNTAAAKDLERLPSIGSGRAEEIVSHRAEYGPFETVESLLDVYGIGTGILEDITPYITLD